MQRPKYKKKKFCPLDYQSCVALRRTCSAFCVPTCDFLNTTDSVFVVVRATIVRRKSLSSRPASACRLFCV